ncbi:MAG: glycosyltransferase [Bacteroidales bacterium]|nr:glycosyltransferase [Bacteroidales bacterium]
MGDFEMILSIVVPVNNVENYLSKCLDSILNQDIAKDDYEIVVVNDGSTDNSGEIARGYASRYPNIILINQENRGLSGARNSGIMAAQGKYIQFVDSDDYLEPNVLGALVERAERDNLDVLRFNYRNVNENYEEFWPNKTPKQTWGYEESVVDGVTFLNERLGYACYAVQFLIRKELLTGCLFKPNIYFEDVEWTPRMLLKAKRVSSTKEVLYNYLVRDGSITKGRQTMEKKRKIVEDKMSLIASMRWQMKMASDTRWYEGIISGTVISVLGCVVKDFYTERDVYIKTLKQAGVFPLSDYHLNKGAQRKRKLINISPRLYCLILKLTRK